MVVTNTGLQNREPCGRREPPGAREGYALYFVLVLATIIGILSSVAIAASHRAYLAALHQKRMVQARNLAVSSLARAEFFLGGGDGHDQYWEADSFVEPVPPIGEVRISCKRFGVFTRFTGCGKARNTEVVLDGIIGRELLDLLYPVITQTGSISGLLIDDNCKIEGAVVFDNGFLARGSNKRKIPGAEQWVHMRKSAALPFDPAPLDSEFARLSDLLVSSLSDTAALTGDHTVQDGVRGGRLVVLGDLSCMSGLFRDATIVAAGTLTFRGNVRVEGCQCVAEKVVVDGGTTSACLVYSQKGIAVKAGLHASQFFSPDSVTVENDARLNESVLVSKRGFADSTLSGGIHLAPRGRYRLVAICYADSAVRGNQGIRGAAITAGKDCRVQGVLITDGVCVLGCAEFHGHVWAQTFWGIDNAGRPAPSFLHAKIIDTTASEQPFPLVGSWPVKLTFRRR